MAIRKKRFPCGHLGKGQFCRRCYMEEQKKAEEEAAEQRKRGERAEWHNLFAQDEIDLRVLPSRGLVLKARLILSEIKKGRSYMDFSGKRMTHNRRVVSVPVGRGYRLLFVDNGGILEPKIVLSHEDYNKFRFESLIC